ncbi:MAG: hypothetical protein AB7U20_13300 [Planctomycetaceae bacterium]
MRTISLNEVSEQVRVFLEHAAAGDGVIVVAEDTGEPRIGVFPYSHVSCEERERAWRDIQAIQLNVQRRLDAAGKTEEELDAILQEDE